jgi:methylglutaconyl-CoA hydratase
MTYSTITLTEDALGVATLTLNRPDKRNAMNSEMCEELSAAAAQINASLTIRVVVLTGAGSVFCAGGDLDWMRQQFDADRATRMAEARKIAMALYALNTMDKPLIGKINGTAMGGGLGLVSVCDAPIMDEDAKCGFTETRLGLVPATISPYVIARMGEGPARRVFMSSRIFDGWEAQSLGLVARAVPTDALDAAVEEEIRPYLGCAPEAVTTAKRLVRSQGAKIDEELIERTITLLADTWETASAQEGIAGFFAKKKPGWVVER